MKLQIGLIDRLWAESLKFFIIGRRATVKCLIDVMDTFNRNTSVRDANSWVVYWAENIKFLLEAINRC